MVEPGTITQAASESAFQYAGRWHVDAAARRATTITNGSTVEFGFTGQQGRLIFDVTKTVVRPCVVLWVDGQGPMTVIPDDRGIVELPVPWHDAGVGNRRHAVRWMANVDSGYLTNIDNWKAQQGALVFLGVELEADGALFSLPLNRPVVEFIGDSITAGLGILKTATVEYGLPNQYPQGNWPEWVGQWLGVTPWVTGYGGQGIVNPGTGGVPSAPEAFRWVYQGRPWLPKSAPAAVVIYHGTNDRSFSAAQYQGYLKVIREAYSAALIFAIVPHNRADHVASIQSAVQWMMDPRIVFLNYSQGVIAKEDTCDGTHLNPGGTVRLAMKVADDLRGFLAAKNIRL